MSQEKVPKHLIQTHTCMCSFSERREIQLFVWELPLVSSEPWMTKPTKWVCAQRRVFAVRMKKAWVLSYPLSAQRRLWSDWADAQADLSLRWAHTHFVGFVMSWLCCVWEQPHRLACAFALPMWEVSFTFWPAYFACLKSISMFNRKCSWFGYILLSLLFISMHGQTENQMTYINTLNFRNSITQWTVKSRYS